MKNSTKLTFTQGISIGIGSIIGSGVLFLPSMTLAMAGNDALLGWLLMIALCIPGLYFLGEMVQESTDNDGIAGFVALGLGKDIGNTIPILLLGTVCIGMPSAAIVAGRYVQSYWIDIPYLSNLLPFAMIGITIWATVKGIRTSASLNTAITVLLLMLGLVLLVSSTREIKEIKVPLFDYNLKNILNSAVLAFWAFAGFENLTFLANKFEKPKRDLLLSASIAVIICGLLYLGLTYNISMLIPKADLLTTTGLMQLGDFLRPSHVSRFLISVFAFLAVMVNLISWTAGISMAIVSSANNGMLPRKLGIIRNDVPTYAVLALGAVFLVSTSIGLLSPSIFESMLTLVSSNFLVLYLLSLVSYFRFSKDRTKKALSLVLIIAIGAVLASYKWLLFYPLVLIASSMAFSHFKTKTKAQNA